MRGAYNTRQKRELMRFIQGRSQENFSVDEALFELRERGEKIGRSTVYRYLELLAEQGNVRKYQNAHGVTQYQHVENAADCDEHFHMMCSRCGRLMHVNCSLMRQMSEHMMNDHGFKLDPRETILVGLCRNCQGEGGEAVEHGPDCHEGCHHSV